MIAGFLAAAFGVLLWVKGAAWLDANGSQIGTHFVLLWLILLGYWWLLSAEPKDFMSSPGVIRVEDNGIILAKRSPWLSVGTVVSIFEKQDDFEIFLCNGETINVQTNYLVQIKLTPESIIFDDTVKKCRSSRTNLIIKPGIRR